MRRLFCLFLTLLLLTAPALSEVSGNLLGLSLLTDMTDGTKNAAVSPLSLQMALSLAREGAAGETRAELDALLAGDAIDTETLLDNARYADMYEVVTEEDVLAELGALLAGEAIDIEVLLAGIFAAPSVPGLRAANAGFVDPEVELLPGLRVARGRRVVPAGRRPGKHQRLGLETHGRPHRQDTHRPAFAGYGALPRQRPRHGGALGMRL